MSPMTMRDTTDAARREQIASIRRMEPGERVRVAVEMSEDVRRIAAAGARLRHPEWSDASVRRAVLSSIYGRAFVDRVLGADAADA